MKRVIEIRENFCTVVDNNGTLECSVIPTVWLTMGDTFIAEDDMEISSNGKKFNVSKGDIVYLFHAGKDKTEIVTFKNEVVSNYIKTQLEEREKRMKEQYDGESDICKKVSAF